MRAIPPSIDPFNAKNQELADTEVLGLVRAADLIVQRQRAARRSRAPSLRGHPRRAASGPEIPLVVQVSRWDRLKDMVGVLEAFVQYVHSAPAQLVLAGPAVTGVSDDPEGKSVWEDTVAVWSGLTPGDRSRVHLAAVSMEDPIENALVINALQRHATVVVQKSLAEGFGLTVAEAMWKSRPVVASAVGGIVDQVIHDETGLLVEDPHDLESCGAAVTRLLNDPTDAARLARNGRSHVEHRFLGDRHLLQYAELLTELIGTS